MKYLCTILSDYSSTVDFMFHSVLLSHISMLWLLRYHVGWSNDNFLNQFKSVNFTGTNSEQCQLLKFKSVCTITNFARKYDDFDC